MAIPVLLANPAMGGLVRVSNYYDRNPANKTNGYDNQGVAPHGATTRVSYTVPSGRKAIIDSLSVFIRRITVATTIGEYGTFATYTAGALGSTPLQTDSFNNTVGAIQEPIVTQCGAMFAGDVLAVGDYDTSTGGTVEYAGSYKVIEFDA